MEKETGENAIELSELCIFCSSFIYVIKLIIILIVQDDAVNVLWIT